MVGATGRPRPVGPDIPADIEVRDLDRDVRAELRALPKGAADTVARHLVAAGRFLDSDPARALEHAQAARLQAARVASVREAVGLAAYHAGEWRMAIAELRAFRRFTGSDVHLAVIADSERALGRPEKAIELAGSPEAAGLDTETRAELLIVAAGARQDQGDLERAIASLEVPELRTQRTVSWLARLRYAYAELLLAAGRPDEAREWFVQAADVDADGVTDAGERVLDLDGFLFTDEDDMFAADGSELLDEEDADDVLGDDDSVRAADEDDVVEPDTLAAGRSELVDEEDADDDASALASEQDGVGTAADTEDAVGDDATASAADDDLLEGKTGEAEDDLVEGPTDGADDLVEGPTDGADDLVEGPTDGADDLVEGPTDGADDL
ncbi:hypothetical protein, partial [Cryptosporangium minutisporangium]